MSKGWIKLRCSCGAEWAWWGHASEATFLERMWRRDHTDHKVTELERFNRAA